ncbi:hypothetical protein GCM10027355_26930 [Haloplanus salinarum]
MAVCEPCERGFESAAQTNDVDVRIERSTATMRVHRNGSATWTVENRLNDTAAFENTSLRRSVAEEAILIHDARLLSTSVSGDTLRMRYRTPDAATEAAGGTLRVDYFRDDPGAMVRNGLGADRLTLVAPEGMVVERGLPGADVSGRRMTVTAFEGSGDGPFVMLAPADDPLAPLWSLVAVSLPMLPVVGRNLFLLVAVPAAVFAGGLAALAWVTDRADLGTTATPDRRALVVAALGVLALAHPLYAGVVLAGASPPLFAAGVGTIVLGGSLSIPAVRDGLSTRRLAALIAFAFAAALAAGFLLRTLASGDLSIHEGADVVGIVLPALPVYAVTLVGYAAAADRLRHRHGLAAAVGALALVLGATFPIASRGGTLYFLSVVLAVLGAVAAVVVGVPFFLLGYGLVDPSGRGPRGAADG